MAKKATPKKAVAAVSEDADVEAADIEEIKAASTSVQLVQMVRDEGMPSTADVHPDSVAEYLSAGWREAK